MFILIFPLSFRFTCYYYRKAYYRSFAAFAAPVARSARSSPRQAQYKGETRLLIFQNLAPLRPLPGDLLFIPSSPTTQSRHLRPRTARSASASAAVAGADINADLLGGYTFGCHSFRHLIGGHAITACPAASRPRAPESIRGRARAKLNVRHMLFAWLSLFWVGFTDFYVRLVSMGVITDFNTWGLTALDVREITDLRARRGRHRRRRCRTARRDRVQRRGARHGHVSARACSARRTP